LQLRYADDFLHRIATEASFVPAGWSDAELEAFLLVAQCATAAIGPQDLFAFRSLGLRELTTDVAVVSLSAERQMKIQFKTDATSQAAVVDVSTAETEAQ
jgi:hypothetical protein